MTRDVWLDRRILLKLVSFSNAEKLLEIQELIFLKS